MLQTATQRVMCYYLVVSGWYLSILALAEYWSMRVVTVFTVGFSTVGVRT